MASIKNRRKTCGDTGLRGSVLYIVMRTYHVTIYLMTRGIYIASESVSVPGVDVDTVLFRPPAAVACKRGFR